jgi:hypothetical protein
MEDRKIGKLISRVSGGIMVAAEMEKWKIGRLEDWKIDQPH